MAVGHAGMISHLLNLLIQVFPQYFVEVLQVRPGKMGDSFRQGSILLQRIGFLVKIEVMPIHEFPVAAIKISHHGAKPVHPFPGMILRYTHGSNAAGVRSQCQQVLFHRGNYLGDGIHLLHIIFRAHAPGSHGSLVSIFCNGSHCCARQIVWDSVSLLMV